MDFSLEKRRRSISIETFLLCRCAKPPRRASPCLRGRERCAPSSLHSSSRGRRASWRRVVPRVRRAQLHSPT